MASTSAVHLTMRRRRAARLVPERVEGVTVEGADGAERPVRTEDGERVASLAAAAPDETETRVEYLDEGGGPAARAARRVRRLFAGRERGQR